MSSIREAFTEQVSEMDRAKFNSVHNRPMAHSATSYDYICRICNGCRNYHISIQRKYPHQFVNGEYRQLLPMERYPFIDGIPVVN